MSKGALAAEKANTLLGCVRGPCPSAQHSGLPWAPKVERHRPTEEDSAKSHKAGKELEHLSHEASLTMGTVQPGEEKAQDISSTYYKYLKCGGKTEPSFFQ